MVDADTNFDYAVDPANERPQQAPLDTPGWSENAFFDFWEPVHGIGGYIHLSRQPIAELWESIVVVYLPGGRLLVNRAFGRQRNAESLGNERLWASCEQPLERWRIGFDGVARETSTDAAARALVDDGPVSALTFEFTFDRLAPAWQLPRGEMATQTWASGHYQQAGTVTGTLTHDGRTYAIACTGYRDHSVGTRDLSPFLESMMVNGQFPSGRLFMGMDVWMKSPSQDMNRGYVFVDGVMHDARVVRAAPRIDAAANPHRFELELATDIGPVHLEAEVLHAVAFTMPDSGQWLIGAGHHMPDLLLVVEAPVRWTWDGEIGYGHREGGRKVGTHGADDVLRRRAAATAIAAGARATEPSNG